MITSSIPRFLLLISGLSMAGSAIGQPISRQSGSVWKIQPRDQMLGEISRLVPERVLDYGLAEGAIYTKDNVYEYLNDEAAIYLTYDFRGLLAKNYVNSNGSEIMFHMFDMGTPAEAFGIFSQEREGNPGDMNVRSDYSPGICLFCKDRYYVSIKATRVNRNANNAIMRLGRATEGMIYSNEWRIDILDLLPSRGLDSDRVRYMHSYLALRQHYDLGSRDILNMNGKVDALLGEYSREAGVSVLLVLNYPDDRAARKGADGYLGYMKEKPGVKAEAGRSGFEGILSWGTPEKNKSAGGEGRWWSSVVRRGALLVIVLETPEIEEAKRLSDGVLTRRRKM